MAYPSRKLDLNLENGMDVGQLIRRLRQGVALLVPCVVIAVLGPVCVRPASASTTAEVAVAGESANWKLTESGQVFGNPNYGGMLGRSLNAPLIAMSGTPDGKGYWLAGRDGGVFAFGDAGFAGSLATSAQPSPIVGIAQGPNDGGYFLASSSGGVFAYGSAKFAGSMGGHRLNSPIVGIASSPTGKGYWLIAADGGVFAFGDAGFYGSMGGASLDAPVVGIACTPDGRGYWLVGADMGVFAFGDAQFSGSGVTIVGAVSQTSGRVIGISDDGSDVAYTVSEANSSAVGFGGGGVHPAKSI